jgi:hypothetical protein
MAKKVCSLTLDNTWHTQAVAIDIDNDRVVGGIGILQLQDIPQYKRSTEQHDKGW